jgi:hypothetical protein
MPIRAVCPKCSSTLSAPDTAAGKVIRCPKCGASVGLLKSQVSPPPAAATRSATIRPQEDEDERPRKHRPAPDEEDDQPRKKSRKKPNKSAGSLVWVLAAVGAVLVIVLGVGGFFVVRAVLAARDNLPAVAGGGGPSSIGIFGSARPKYVPGVSEDKLAEYMKDPQHEHPTEDEVYAIMGEPTRRGTPITARKNGQVFTVYEAAWEVPGSGVTSKIDFVNGRAAGMILGLKITPSGSGDRK